MSVGGLLTSLGVGVVLAMSIGRTRSGVRTKLTGPGSDAGRNGPRPRRAGDRMTPDLPPTDPGDDSSRVRLMISPEPGVPGRARVIGSLTAESAAVLLDAVQKGLVVLDLSEVDHADDSAVRALAQLWPKRCTLVACPRWLELWLAHAQRATGPT